MPEQAAQRSPDAEHAAGTPLDRLLARVAATTSGHRLPEPLPIEPFALFKAWFDEAQAGKRVPNPNAMSLATVGADGAPSNRIVLCRGIDGTRGCVTFFTNYEGRKGRELVACPRASATFHWDHADRQVRVEGVASKTSEAESDAYFRSRRWESRLSAWVSNQSEPIVSRGALLAKLPPVLAKLRLDAARLLEEEDRAEIPRPPHWGGFHLRATRVELWVGGPGRLHDRAEWTREVGNAPDAASSAWQRTRVQP